MVQRFTMEVKISAMKDAVRKLDIEYGLNLKEEEVDQIAEQAQAAQRLFQKLYEVDVQGIVPALKIDPAEKS
jgi:Asp-tRNA(Asn)/Glu-tRNA(Gln) amidotransferase C subunit